MQMKRMVIVGCFFLHTFEYRSALLFRGVSVQILECLAIVPTNFSFEVFDVNVKCQLIVTHTMRLNVFHVVPYW